MCRKQTFATRNANTRLWYREVTSDDNADVRVGTERVPVVGVWAEHSTCPPRSRQKRAIALTKNGALARGGCSRSRGKIAKACRDGKCGRGWCGGCSGKGELGGGGSSPRAPGPGADAGQKLAEAASEDATPPGAQTPAAGRAPPASCRQMFPSGGQSTWEPGREALAWPRPSSGPLVPSVDKTEHCSSRPTECTVQFLPHRAGRRRADLELMDDKRARGRCAPPFLNCFKRHHSLKQKEQRRPCVYSADVIKGTAVPRKGRARGPERL